MAETELENLLRDVLYNSIGSDFAERAGKALKHEKKQVSEIELLRAKLNEVFRLKDIAARNCRDEPCCCLCHRIEALKGE